MTIVEKSRHFVELVLKGIERKMKKKIQLFIFIIITLNLFTISALAVDNEMIKEKKEDVMSLSDNDFLDNEIFSTNEAVAFSNSFSNITNTDARLYKTKNDFEKSKIYNEYSILQKMKFSGSYIIPGLKNTNVLGKSCTTMCPQGICFTSKYLLISAYDTNLKVNSVIYVLDKVNKKYLTAIILENSSHVGGLAYDGYNIWVCNPTSSNYKSVGLIKETVINNAVKQGKDNIRINYAVKRNVDITADFMTYYNGKLYVGECNEPGQGDGFVYEYSISNKKESSPSLKKKNKMYIPESTQGIAMTGDGTLVVSISYGYTIGKATTKSELRTYKPSWDKPNSKGIISKNKRLVLKRIPLMAQNVVVCGTNTFISFESATYKYRNCPYKMDRIAKFQTTELIK